MRDRLLHSDLPHSSNAISPNLPMERKWTQQMQINCWHTSIHLVKRVLAAPCREDVDALNAQQLRELPGEARRFVAQDAGSPEVLAAACPARRTLDLKVRKAGRGVEGWEASCRLAPLRRDSMRTEAPPLCLLSWS